MLESFMWSYSFIFSLKIANIHVCAFSNPFQDLVDRFRTTARGGYCFRAHLMVLAGFCREIPSSHASGRFWPLCSQRPTEPSFPWGETWARGGKKAVGQGGGHRISGTAHAKCKEALQGFLMSRTGCAILRTTGRFRNPSNLKGQWRTYVPQSSFWFQTFTP